MDKKSPSHNGKSSLLTSSASILSGGLNFLLNALVNLANVTNNLVALIPLLHNFTCTGKLPAVRSSRTETLPKPLHDPWPHEHGAQSLSHTEYIAFVISGTKPAIKREKYFEYFGRAD